MICFRQPLPLPTHIQGSTQIDHIWISQQLVPYIDAFGSPAFNDGVLSDHRMLFMDICLRQYLHSSIQVLIPRPQRYITSQRPDNIDKYLEHMERYFTQHHIRARSDNLRHLSPSDAVRMADAIDRRSTRGPTSCNRSAA